MIQKSNIPKTLKVIFLWGIALTGGCLFLKFFKPFGIGPWTIYDFYIKNVYWPLHDRFQILLKPYIYAAFGLTLFLEYLIPAVPEQRFLSASFFQDFIWFFYETILEAIVISVYIDGLRWAYNTHLSFLTIHSVAEWPYWVRFILGVLLLDFCYWVQHYINHKVPWLWELHTVHHSQTELNFFTDFRYHILEYFIRFTILVVPFLIFSINTPTVVVFTIVSTWYTRFYHGNIRTNLGFLRYVLVTPQSHRVHHSKLLQHRDMNFGSLFCVWDRIFKTQYCKYDEYPETGIDDADFPHEHDKTLSKVIFMPLQQMAYPVIRIKDRIRDYFTKRME
jgi:sterol desaturase/sphingolipid hydroxylase (fatty acid hydroxylase superfamily)